MSSEIFRFQLGEFSCLSILDCRSPYGHTAGHMSLDISSEGQHLLFIGDTFIHPFHIEHPETITAFDHQPERMIATRLRLLHRAAKERSLVIRVIRGSI